MTQFLQYHLLTTYGPSNPNRDDQGRPKQASVGGSPRLRLSSQSYKRALRTAPSFTEPLSGHIGIRTKRFYECVKTFLCERSIAEDKAEEVATIVAEIFGSLEGANKVYKSVKNDKKTKDQEFVSAGPRRAHTLAFISPDEREAAQELALALAQGTETLTEKDVKKQKKDLQGRVLRRADGAVDIAMFGRMLADGPDFNRDAAVQVSHAITTHRACAEEDYFTAVDDLNRSDESGAGHLGETSFGSGVYYQYLCVNVDLLVENLAGDRVLAAKALEALTRTLATATPTGKQNSFAHHPRPHYILAECGTQAPRDLSGAFFEAVTQRPWLEQSVERLEQTRRDLDRAYGQAWQSSCVLHVGRDDTASLDDMAAFAGSVAKGA